MMMVFADDIGIIALGELFHRLFDCLSIALVREAAVSVVGVDDCPVVGIGQIATPVPRKGLKAFPVARRSFCGIFQIKFAKFHN